MQKHEFQERSRKERQRQRRKKRRIRFFILLPLILIIAGGLGYGSYLYNKVKAVTNNAYKELERGEKSVKREQAVEPIKDNISILIMGVDESNERKNQYGDAIRTDALLLATINKDDKSVKLLSIPRDSYVFIPSRKRKDKITHAHVFGGIDSTIDTVEEFLNVPVDYYLKFNFQSFTKIVDALGGIDVDVPVSVTEQDSRDQANVIHLKKGYHHLNGEQALALARTRHIDSDYMRGRRQQLILEAIAQKALSIETVSKLDTIIGVIESDLKTNLTFDNMMTITKNMIASPLNIEKVQVKGEDKYINNIYYYVPDDKELRITTKLLQDHLNVTSKFEHKVIQ